MPGIHDFSWKRDVDGRDISAFTRVFDALCPAMTLIVRSSLHKVSVGRESVSNDPDALCLTVIKSRKSR